MNQNLSILFKLVKASSSEAVDRLIKTDPFFRNVEWWPLGDNECNFSIVGTQQTDPINALTEKIVNSIDALLMLECYKRKISPDDSHNTPTTMKEAVEKFFNVSNADFSNISLQRRRKIAEKIKVIADGSKQKPSIAIVDTGEGQLPEYFSKTFLSLPRSESNKIKINFVQGKFNMGGTGALMFCGDMGHRYQLILSKRHSKIVSSSKWGFTLVKQTFKKGMRNPVFEFFCEPNGHIFSFYENNLNVLPNGGKLKEGTFIKLYSYDLPNPSNINIDLWRDLNRRLYAPALPITTYETRFKKGKIHGASRVMEGNLYRIDSVDHKWVEDQFPIHADLGKFGDRIIEITLFKDELSEKVKGETRTRQFNKSEYTTASESIFLTVNGQTHHTIGRSTLKSKANLKNIADYLMIHIDVSNLGAEAGEIFHGNRQQVRRNQAYIEFEERLISDLKDNPLLKSWDEEYKKRKLAKIQPDIHFIRRTAAKILRENPAWSRKLALGEGVKISKAEGNTPKNFRGNNIPTTLELKGNSLKEIPINRKWAWVKFETDAQNDYLTRKKSKGAFLIKSNSEIEKSYWLRDGIISLKLITPKNIKIEDTIDILAVLTRPSNNNLEVKFTIKFVKEISISKSNKSTRRKPSEEEYDLPELDAVEKERWDEFGWTGRDIALVDGSFIRVNVDSDDLHNFYNKYQQRFKPDSIVKAYKTAVYLYAFIIDNDLGDREDKDELVPKIMQGISKVVLPLNFEEILKEID